MFDTIIDCWSICCYCPYIRIYELELELELELENDLLV